MRGSSQFARALAGGGHRVPVRAPLARGRPAAARVAGARHPPGAGPSRGGGRAHGRRPLQDAPARSPRCSEPGPGSANLLPGVLTARHEGVPVLVITSQHRLGIVYPSRPPPSRARISSTCSARSSSGAARCSSGAGSRRCCASPSARCGTGVPDRSTSSLPAPILYEIGDDQSAPIIPPAGLPRRGTPRLRRASWRKRRRCSPRRERPVVIAGAGVDRAGANSSLLEIVELLGCPVLTTMAGRSTVRSDHPNYVFGFGRRRRSASPRGRRAADRRLAGREPRPPLRRALGRPRRAAGDPDRRRPQAPRRHPPAQPRHTGRRPQALEGIAGLLRTMALPARDGEDLARYRAPTRRSEPPRRHPSSNGRDPGSIPPTLPGR